MVHSIWTPKLGLDKIVFRYPAVYSALCFIWKYMEDIPTMENCSEDLIEFYYINVSLTWNCASSFSTDGAGWNTLFGCISRIFYSCSARYFERKYSRGDSTESLSKLIYFAKTAMRNSILVDFVIRCFKIESELNKKSKLFTQYLINMITKT